eukprot:COSAG02_NODE_1800_length_10896_cov_4.915162_5_plen_80_part_00
MVASPTALLAWTLVELPRTIHCTACVVMSYVVLWEEPNQTLIDPNRSFVLTQLFRRGGKFSNLEGKLNRTTCLCLVLPR